jgi:hypothetical protein
MERLTERDGLIVHSKFKGDWGSQNILHRLAEYEDAEEDRLLIRVECRCKDCVHVDYAGCLNTTCYCMKNSCFMQEDDFCKYAEKPKTEAEQALAKMKGE